MRCANIEPSEPLKIKIPRSLRIRKRRYPASAKLSQIHVSGKSFRILNPSLIEPNDDDTPDDEKATLSKSKSGSSNRKEYVKFHGKLRNNKI